MLDPILTAPIAVQIHVTAAMFAVMLGPIALYRTRRDWIHKVVGRAWVGGMVIVAGSGFFIEAYVYPIIGTFGPIHLLSAWTLFALTCGVLAIRRRDVAAHQGWMRGLYWQALGIAGMLTLLPGRKMNQVLFGEAETLGFWAIGTVGTLAVILLIARRGQKSAF